MRSAARKSRTTVGPPPIRTSSSPAACGEVESLLRRSVDEVEHGAAFHLDQRARMVREHEHRRVERRVRPPPAMPLVVGAEIGPRADCGRTSRPMTSAPNPTLRRSANALSTPVVPPD